jgi:hypothetical protein
MSGVKLSALALLVLMGGVACSDDDTGPSDVDEFEASLTGAAERPDPVTTTATGTATVEIDDEDESFTVTVTIGGTGIVDLTMAHIHIGDVNTAGAIAVNLLPTPPTTSPFTGSLVNGTFTSVIAPGETFATLAAKMRAGNTYINVHNAVNTAGHIRGQLVVDN